MYGTALLRVSAASDPGLKRSVNEDRLLADVQQGVFLIADGMGGHAAGDVAAQTALETIREIIGAHHEWTETAARQAIAAANNRIFSDAQGDLRREGMACVLTLALLDADRLTWGHVGDSRLYILSHGRLRKLTRDHSPVGECEDNGEIDEHAAMRHPQRNEVFRDVGSALRRFDDENFIDSGSTRFNMDEGILLCSDGLSDQLNSAEILQTVASCGENLEGVAERLIEAANERGGSDNVSVIFVAGAEFKAAAALHAADARQRHAVTRARSAPSRFRALNAKLRWLVIGILLGALLAAAWVKRDDWRERLAKLSIFHQLGQGKTE